MAPCGAVSPRISLRRIQMASFGLGFLCALIALVLCVVFAINGSMSPAVALLIGLVALSRLVA
jgi:hypothetical protein